MFQETPLQSQVPWVFQGRSPLPSPAAKRIILVHGLLKYSLASVCLLAVQLLEVHCAVFPAICRSQG